MAIQQRIRYERRARDLTQAALATILGVHPTIIQKIEHGKLAPSPRLIKGLHKALEIEYEAFFQDTHDHNALDTQACDNAVMKQGGGNGLQPNLYW